MDTELVAACEMLDEEYPPLESVSVHDYNSYAFGRIGSNHVVIACLPMGRYGIASAAGVAKDMLRSFESIKIRLMVGIGGGAPSSKNDIRLGDIVVGCPVGKECGVVPYNFGKAIQNQEFERTGSLSSPPKTLLTALRQLSTLHTRRGSQLAGCIQGMIAKNKRLEEKYQYPGEPHDRLYGSDYVHQDGDSGCEFSCGTTSPPLVQRPQREPGLNEPVVHYGLIASADQLMKNAKARDHLTEKYDIMCFEMEAAGLMNDFSCVVIRGICDYSDSHKNKLWQGYAAAAAAAYAKQLLGIIPGLQIASAKPAATEISEWT